METFRSQLTAAKRAELLTEMQASAGLAQRVKALPGGLEKWIGYVVKKRFEQIIDPRFKAECMWVHIEGHSNGRLLGRLWNKPVYATYVKHGDAVIMEESEIIAAEWCSE
jgi:hypothetical protein